MSQPASASTRSRGASPACQRNFVVGQDYQGHWLAVETHGLGGGIFADRRTALRYAAFETGWRPNAVKIVGGQVLLAL